jgi:hypothetical protein
MKVLTTHRKAALIAAGVTVLATGTAYAAGEHASASPATAVNPKTCRFLHREVDPKTGPTWKNLRTYVVYEDARHDAKMACLARHMPKPVAPVKVKFGYTQVAASGLGKTVTATCPAGYKVTGGGSRSETTGSYPSSNSSWTVVRDHLSPKRLDVTAVCVRVS